jgi:signal transduction histidine kinase
MDSNSFAAGHLGLQGMRERVALLGGEIEINSSKGFGTDILITLPLGRYQRSEKL